MTEVHAFDPIRTIARKRDGQVLTSEEIAQLIRGYVADEIADYQMSAFAMAVCLRGMTAAETATLTEQMLLSGATLEAVDRSLRVDKHSTGGIGDKSSLVLAPLLACCGLQVPMISGRGLAMTGGTIDKLESIPGFRTDLSAGEIQRIVSEVGCVITGATADLVPADRRLYALRDVTATVPAIPLITASIMSKKLAENLSALVLDVKVGSAAFMKTRDAARRLAQAMVEVGTRMNVKTTALVTSMDQPNGRMVGNAVEIDEALATLAGSGPEDLRQIVLELGCEILLMQGQSGTLVEAKQTLADHLDSGRALSKFREMVRAQGGDLDAVRHRAAAWTLTSDRPGFVAAIDGESLGLALVEMGGGRKQLRQPIDHSVGLEVLVRLGDSVERGQPLLHIFAPTAARSRGLRLIEGAIKLDSHAPSLTPLVVDRIRGEADASDQSVHIDARHAHVASGRGSSEASQPEGVSHNEDDTDGALQPEALIDAALRARRQAYAPYSGFSVGAAVLTKSGRIFAGANVENASYGLTICAERVAMATAIAAGEDQFRMLVVASPGGAAPCGACRQFVAEFSPDLPLLLIDVERPGERFAVSLNELLPHQFALPRPKLDQHSGDASGHEAGQRAAEHGP